MRAIRQASRLMQTYPYLGADHMLEDVLGEREWSDSEKRERRYDEICDQLKAGDEYSDTMTAEMQDSDIYFHLMDWASKGYQGLNIEALKSLIERAVKVGADEIIAKEFGA